MGSDGLWDNCYEEDILSLLPESPDAIEKVKPTLYIALPESLSLDDPRDCRKSCCA